MTKVLYILEKVIVMMSSANPSAPRSRGVLTMTVLAAALSAVSQPTPKTLASLIASGVPETGARLLLHVTPVLLIIGALVFGRVLGRGRAKTTRWMIYALLGAVAGFGTAYCLDLLIGVPSTIAAINGPMREPDDLDVILWAIGSLMMALAAMLTAVAAIGSPAAYAISIEEDADPEAYDVRRSERRMFGVSAAALVMTGIAYVSLAVARQSEAAAVVAPVVVASVAAVASLALNIVLWRALDEMQRRTVISGYALSAIAATIAAFGWALVQATGNAPPIDGSAALVFLSITQLIVTSFATIATGHAAPGKST